MLRTSTLRTPTQCITCNDRLIQVFIAAQDIGIKALIDISESKIKIEECSQSILIAVPMMWKGVSIALTNLQHTFSLPAELEGFSIQILLAE